MLLNNTHKKHSYFLLHMFVNRELLILLWVLFFLVTPQMILLKIFFFALVAVKVLFFFFKYFHLINILYIYILKQISLSYLVFIPHGAFAKDGHLHSCFLL